MVNIKMHIDCSTMIFDACFVVTAKMVTYMFLEDYTPTNCNCIINILWAMTQFLEWCDLIIILVCWYGLFLFIITHFLLFLPKSRCKHLLPTNITFLIINSVPPPSP